MKRFVSACLFVACCSAPADAAWRFAWGQDPDSHDPTCTASTDPMTARAGSRETAVRLGIQAGGLMTITSDDAAFDAEKLYAMWARVDDHPLAVHLDRSPDGRTLTFSEDDSVSLHRQFENGTSVSVSVAFAPHAAPVVLSFPLDGYRTVTAQYKGCRGLLLSPGWMGVSTTDAAENDPELSWIAAHTPYRSAGIAVVAVDPRKEASRNDLRPGDRIIGMNNGDAKVSTFIGALKSMPVGSTITLDVLRERAVLKKIITRPASASLPVRDAD